MTGVGACSVWVAGGAVAVPEFGLVLGRVIAGWHEQWERAFEETMPAHIKTEARAAEPDWIVEFASYDVFDHVRDSEFEQESGGSDQRGRSRVRCSCS